MARSCGIRLGPRRYEIVVLDGSAKKHKIAAFEAGEFDPSADDPLRAATATLKQAVKRLGVPKDNVGLVIDSGHAAFRRLSLPFSDTAKIEQVVKYEIESELPQWNIDDVIVDWHKLAQDEASSDLLITAVPKDDIQAALDVVGGAGVEPFQVELETSAMVNAAFAAEICNLDDAQLLVHIGDYSTSVVVMDAGEVREMRVIHIGALTHEVLAPEPPPAPEAEAEDQQAADEATPRPPAPPPPEVDPIEASRRVDQAIKRIRRELGRTLSGARTVNAIEAIYVCGMELPGLVGSTVLDVPVYVLDCFEEDSGQPADGFGQLVVAYGAAVRELGGGVIKPQLRREELRFTGTWERIEFPLAVACLLLTTFLGVVFILQRRELSYLDMNGTRYWLESSNNFLLGTPKLNTKGHMSPPPKDIQEYAERFADRANIDKSIDPIDALRRIDFMVQQEVDKLKRDLGQDAAVSQPQSALVGAHLVLAALEKEHALWRPSIWSIAAETLPPRGNNEVPERVKVTLNLVFHEQDAATATKHYEDFLAELPHAVPGFYAAPQRGVKALDNGLGVEVLGQTVEVNVKVFYDLLAVEAGKLPGSNG